MQPSDVLPRPRAGEAISAAPSLVYRPAIDGLRAVAVLGVFFFHLRRRLLPGGFTGVDIFFVISGYLITSIILRDCERGCFAFARFYQRRIARLAPAFFAMAVVTLAAAAVIYSKRDLASAAASLAGAAAFVANFKFMVDGNYFVASPDAQPFLHCWSLSVEEQFYLFFPALFLLLFRTLHRRRALVLTLLCLLSLVACVVETHWRPVWAFYLLPTRAWELLAGSIVAVLPQQGWPASRLLSAVPVAGLALIGLSFAWVTEGPFFPGPLAILPVAGTLCLLFPIDRSNVVVERVLGCAPMALVGRMSYSLYLWHWPVFSLVDYALYSSPGWLRTTLKIGISVAATTACHFLLERPARRILNRPERRWMAFGALAFSLATLIPLGIWVRYVTYLDASPRQLAAGGLCVNRSARHGSLVLMGDSNGSMYGVTMRDVAQKLDMKLTVISVDANDPLPNSSGAPSPLWQQSLAVIQRERPDAVILVCLWNFKLKTDPQRLKLAVSTLRMLTRKVILITQPPSLPPWASREGIREGMRPPFFEEAQELAQRRAANEVVKSQAGEGVAVIDIEPLFTEAGGAIRFTDEKGRDLFLGSRHISSYGADRVESAIEAAIPRSTGVQSVRVADPVR
jgi:peptidoglycan/LPS O-acetylase OafA/YrhL